MEKTDLNTFKTEVIVYHHHRSLDRYLKLKALGVNSRAALIGAFGHEFLHNVHWGSYISLIETSDHYISSFPKYVEVLKDSPMWNAEISALALVSIAGDASLKVSDRLNAIKELNVMFNITIVDENGKTRSGSLTFEDVMRMAAEKRAAGAKAH